MGTRVGRIEGFCDGFRDGFGVVGECVGFVGQGSTQVEVDLSHTAAGLQQDNEVQP